MVVQAKALLLKRRRFEPLLTSEHQDIGIFIEERGQRQLAHSGQQSDSENFFAGDLGEVGELRQAIPVAKECPQKTS